MPRTRGAKTIREPDRTRLREQVCREYEAGRTISAAAKIAGVSYATAYRFLMEAEVVRRKPHESRHLTTVAAGSP